MGTGQLWSADTSLCLPCHQTFRPLFSSQFPLCDVYLGPRLPSWWKPNICLHFILWFSFYSLGWGQKQGKALNVLAWPEDAKLEESAKALWQHPELQCGFEIWATESCNPNASQKRRLPPRVMDCFAGAAKSENQDTWDQLMQHLKISVIFFFHTDVPWYPLIWYTRFLLSMDTGMSMKKKGNIKQIFF